MKIVDTWLDRAQKILQQGILVFEFSIKFVEKIGYKYVCVINAYVL